MFQIQLMLCSLDMDLLFLHVIKPLSVKVLSQHVPEDRNSPDIFNNILYSVFC